MLTQTSQSQPPAQGLSALYQEASKQPQDSTAFRCKQAGPVGPSYLLPEEQATVRRDAFKQLLRLAGLGLAVGGGTRALLGGRNLVRDTQSPVSNYTVAPPVVLHGVPHEEEERRRRKMANAKPKPPWWDFLAQMLPNISTTEPLGDWWGPTAGLAAAGGGLYGGWKLTDWLLDKERETTQEREVEQAKRDYQKALSSQYRAAMKSADDDFGIDQLFDEMMEKCGEEGLPREKQAFLEWIDRLYSTPLGYDNWQAAKGALLAAMALTAGGTGLATYNYTAGQNKQKLLDKALKVRERARSMRAPAPIYTTVDTKDDEADELQYGV